MVIFLCIKYRYIYVYIHIYILDQQIYIQNVVKFLGRVTIKKYAKGFPSWSSGRESACQCRGHGFDPWSGKIPHAAEQLSPCTTTTEPVL